MYVYIGISYLLSRVPLEPSLDAGKKKVGETDAILPPLETVAKHVSNYTLCGILCGRCTGYNISPPPYSVVLSTWQTFNHTQQVCTTVWQQQQQQLMVHGVKVNPTAELCITSYDNASYEIYM